MTHRLLRSLVAGVGAVVLLSGCSDAGDETAGQADDPAGATTTAAPPDTTSPAPEDSRQTTTPPADDARETQVADSVLLTSTDDAFTFETPQGWSEATAQAGDDAVAAARADDRAAGFFTNLVVVTEEPIDDLEESIEQAAATVAGEDGSYTMTGESQVDGETGYGFRIDRTVQDIDIVQAQHWVEHDGVLYILTLSSARDQQEAAVDTLEQIVGSWSWQ